MINGSKRYVAIPVAAVERMGICDGDYLDVTIRWPKTEDYNPDDMLDPVPEKQEKKQNEE